jgi:hypothetical protein
MALLGSTQPVTEMSTRNIPWGGGPPRRDDNLTAISEPIAYTKCGSFNVLEPYGPSRPVTEIALHLPYWEVTAKLSIPVISHSDN